MARKDAPHEQHQAPPLNVAQAVADLTFFVDKVATPALRLRDHLAGLAQLEPAARNAERRRELAQHDVDELDARKVRLADDVAELERVRAQDKATTEALCDALRQQRENAQREYDQALKDMAGTLEALRIQNQRDHAGELARRQQEIASLEERKAALQADLEVIARRAVQPA